MKTFSLAARNLLRNRRRSLTTVLAMIVGSVSVLLFGGYSSNIKYGLQTGLVQNGGHLQLQRHNYYLYGNGNPSAYGIADYQQVMAAVKADAVLAPMLAMVTPSLNLGGLAGNFSKGISRTVVGNGAVVGDLNRMREWNEYGFPWKPKNSELTGSAPDAVVIGTGVARVLQLCAPLKVADCPGQAAEAGSGAAAPADIVALSAAEPAAPRRDTQIEMLAANSHGAPNVAALSVVKAISVGQKELDDMFVGMHLAQAQQLVYGGEAPRVTAIALQLRHTADMEAARARLQQLLGGPLRGADLEVQDFITLNPSYGQIVGMFAGIFSFISLLIGAIVLFTVGNTMSMAVLERTVEIGTLRALGLRRSGIRRLFVCEALLLGATGAALGIALALLGAWLINHGGLSWTPPGNVDPVPLTVRVWGEARMIAGAALGLVFVSVCSAWLPANRASRLAVVDALRHV